MNGLFFAQPYCLYGKLSLFFPVRHSYDALCCLKFNAFKKKPQNFIFEVYGSDKDFGLSQEQ